MSRVISKIVITVFTLYIGGTILTNVGDVMLCTSSSFYKGLSLIGWTITDNVVPFTSGTCNTTGAYAGSSASISNLITSTSGSGILVVVGLVAIASIVMEFVEFKL